MSKAPTSKSPYAKNRITKFIAKRIEALNGVKTQRDIASEVGFSTPNMIAMMKSGDARVPLDRVAGLARALGVDPRFLMRLALEQYLDKEAMRLAEVTLSENEEAIIKLIREVSKDTDPGLNDQRIAAIRQAFGVK